MIEIQCFMKRYQQMMLSNKGSVMKQVSEAASGHLCLIQFIAIVLLFSRFILSSSFHMKIEIIIVDPPRKGLDPGVLQLLVGKHATATAKGDIKPVA